MKPMPCRAAMLAAAVLLAGCVSVPPERSRAAVDAMVVARVGPAYDDSADVPADRELALDDAVRTAFVHQPRLQIELARLGVARADVLDAARLPNPTFDYARLRERGTGASLIGAGITQGFAELLMLPARKRLAGAELARVEQEVAAALVRIAAEVETAWLDAVAAQQLAAMRGLAHEAADASAELAQRYHDAGNIGALQLATERAAAAQARIEQLRADAAFVRARLRLGGALGLDVARSSALRLPAGLPAPLDAEDAPDELLALAKSSRLDLAAARAELAVRDSARANARRWRWLGDFDLGWQRESEPGAPSRHGPTLSIRLPLFHQGQAAIARADAERDASRARLTELELAVEHEVRLGVDRVDGARAVIAQYATALVPAREAVVARQQERESYMLIGAFELLAARREELEAYAGYLEAVHDYWAARGELARAVGARLPSDARIGAAHVAPETIEPAHEHHHGGTP